MSNIQRLVLAVKAMVECRERHYVPLPGQRDELIEAYRTLYPIELVSTPGAQREIACANSDPDYPVMLRLRPAANRCLSREEARQLLNELRAILEPPIPADVERDRFIMRSILGCNLTNPPKDA